MKHRLRFPRIQHFDDGGSADSDSGATTGGGDWGSAGAFDASGGLAGNFDIGQSLAFDAAMGGMPGVSTGPGEWGGWGSWATQDAAGNWGVNDITGNFAGFNAPNAIAFDPSVGQFGGPGDWGSAGLFSAAGMNVDPGVSYAGMDLSGLGGTYGVGPDGGLGFSSYDGPSGYSDVGGGGRGDAGGGRGASWGNVGPSNAVSDVSGPDMTDSLGGGDVGGRGGGPASYSEGPDTSEDTPSGMDVAADTPSESVSAPTEAAEEAGPESAAPAVAESKGESRGESRGEEDTPTGQDRAADEGTPGWAAENALSDQSIEDAGNLAAQDTDYTTAANMVADDLYSPSNEAPAFNEMWGSTPYNTLPNDPISRSAQETLESDFSFFGNPGYVQGPQQADLYSQFNQALSPYTSAILSPVGRAVDWVMDLPNLTNFNPYANLNLTLNPDALQGFELGEQGRAGQNYPAGPGFPTQEGFEGWTGAQQVDEGGFNNTGQIAQSQGIDEAGFQNAFGTLSPGSFDAAGFQSQGYDNATLGGSNFVSSINSNELGPPDVSPQQAFNVEMVNPNDVPGLANPLANQQVAINLDPLHLADPNEMPVANATPPSVEVQQAQQAQEQAQQQAQQAQQAQTAMSLPTMATTAPTGTLAGPAGDLLGGQPSTTPAVPVTPATLDFERASNWDVGPPAPPAPPANLQDPNTLDPPGLPANPEWQITDPNTERVAQGPAATPTFPAPPGRLGPPPSLGDRFADFLQNFNNPFSNPFISPAEARSGRGRGQQGRGARGRSGARGPSGYSRSQATRGLAGYGLTPTSREQIREEMTAQKGQSQEVNNPNAIPAWAKAGIQGRTAAQANIGALFDPQHYNTSMLNAEFLGRLNDAYKAMGLEKNGRELQKSFILNSGFRPETRAETRELGMPTRASQESVKDRSRAGDPEARTAASAFNSKHGTGRAVDIRDGKALQWLHQNGAKFGLSPISPYGRGDMWHIEASEGRYAAMASRAGAQQPTIEEARAAARPTNLARLLDAERSQDRIALQSLFGRGTLTEVPRAPPTSLPAMEPAAPPAIEPSQVPPPSAPTNQGAYTAAPGAPGGREGVYGPQAPAGIPANPLVPSMNQLSPLGHPQPLDWPYSGWETGIGPTGPAHSTPLNTPVVNPHTGEIQYFGEAPASAPPGFPGALDPQAAREVGEQGREGVSGPGVSGPGMTTFQGAPAAPGVPIDLTAPYPGEVAGPPLDISPTNPGPENAGPPTSLAPPNPGPSAPGLPMSLEAPFQGPIAGPPMDLSPDNPGATYPGLPTDLSPTNPGPEVGPPLDLTAPNQGPETAGSPLSLAPEFAPSTYGPDEAGMVPSAEVEPDLEAPPGWDPSLQTAGVTAGKFGDPAAALSAAKGPPDARSAIISVLNHFPAEQRGQMLSAMKGMSDKAILDVLSRGAPAMIDLLAKGAAEKGYSRDQVIGWLNNQYATILGVPAYPGYPGGVAQLGRDMQAAYQAALASPGNLGRTSTAFAVPSITPDVQYAGTPGWVDPSAPPAVPAMEPAAPPAIEPSQIAPPTAPPTSEQTAPPSAPPSVPPSVPEQTPTAPPSAPPSQPAQTQPPSEPPSTPQQIIEQNPTLVASIAQSNGVDMETAALLLLWQLQQQDFEPWRRYQPPPIFAARGGRIKKKKDKEEKDDDFDVLPLEGAQFYIPYDPKGTKTWPKAPDPQAPGGYTSVGREMMRRQREEWEANRRGYLVPKRLTETLGLRINPQNWDNFIANTPRSTNIEDRRFYDPTKTDETMGAGYEEGGRAVHFRVPSTYGTPWGD